MDIGTPEFAQCATNLIMAEDGSCVPESYYSDYVPELTTETSTPSPLPADSEDLAVTGPDALMMGLFALVIIPAGIAAVVGNYFRQKRVALR